MRTGPKVDQAKVKVITDFLTREEIRDLSLKEKCLALNAAGITTVTGKKFSRSNLYSFLSTHTIPRGYKTKRTYAQVNHPEPVKHATQERPQEDYRARTLAGIIQQLSSSEKIQLAKELAK